MSTRRAITLRSIGATLLLLVGAGAALGQGGWPDQAEKIRRGGVDVGKTYGMAPDARYHRIHAEALGLACETCHRETLPPSVSPFWTRPAADVSPDAPGPIDRRACLGCHLAGPGRAVYGPAKP